MYIMMNIDITFMGYNRTIEELKLHRKHVLMRRCLGYNRTIEELKRNKAKIKRTQI